MNSVTRLLAGLAALSLSPGVSALKIPPADMNGWVFQLPADVAQFDVAMHGTLNADAYRDMGNYPAQYIVGDLPENYAQAVVKSLFREPTFSPAGSPVSAGSAVLQLVSMTTVHLWGKGMATRDMTDEVTAQWELRDPAGRVLHEFVFMGRATSPSGLGKAYGPRGRERTGLAHQDLLEKTARGLAASVELQRFALLSELHLQPERSHEHARAKIAAVDDAERNALLQAMLTLAVDRGDFELYSIAQGEVDARSIAELQDESGLLHAVLATGDERLFTSVVSNSTNLDVAEREATPLGRLLLMVRDARALALVSAGASPVARIPGDAFGAAELNFHLAGLLAGDNAKSRAAYAAARAVSRRDRGCGAID